jgi:signal peptide peptidase SppA
MAKQLSKPVRETLDSGLWLGTEAGYETYLQAVVAAAEFQARGGSMEDMMGSGVEVQDNVGVIPIQGPLVPGDAGFMRLFGITGYGNIADALISAVQDSSVHAIVLSIDSPGGQVNGVQDLATLISNVDKVKPVAVHTGGAMMSAAYWLGVSGRRMFASQTAEVLSIGTMMVHMEKTKMLADAGVKATIIRSGKYKALGNPYEPLSDTAKAEMQGKADALSSIFLGHVAERRGMTAAVADRKIGQGRTMLAEDAVAAGGIDVVGSLGDAMAYAKSQAPKPANVRKSLTASVDTPVVASHNSEKPGSDDMNLTEAQLAALASGTPMAEVLKMAVAPPTTTADPVVDEPTPAATAPVIETPAALTPVAAAAPVDVVAFLQGELTKSQGSLVQALADKQVLEGQLTAARSAQEGLLAIARASVRNMTVALGGTSAAAETLGPTEVLAEHARLGDVFKDKFKVGGVAAVTPETDPKPAGKPLINPMFLAMAKGIPTH